MTDDFLHRLRKDPSPEFAARLRAQLRLQPAPARPRGASLLRNLITVLLLGGTAFAVTSMVISGLPESLLLKWYQHSTTPVPVESAAGPANETRRHGPRAMRPWSPYDLRSPGNPAPLRRSAHSETPTTNPPAAADSADTAASVGPDIAPHAASRVAAAAPQSKAQITVVASWSAYPYIARLADDFNRLRASGRPSALSVGISMRDANQWPGPMCGGGTGAPDIAYSFVPVGTVPHRPCPPGPVGSDRSVTAIRAGYEAVALARSPIYGAPDFTRRQLFLALAKWVPDPGGQTVHENPNTTWRQVDDALGAEPIEFLGPPLSSPAGHSMIELLLEGGCRTIPWIAALETTDPARYARICRTVRTDGVYVETPWLEPSRLLSEPNAIGIFGLWSLEYVRMTDLAMSSLDGVEPTAQTIENGAYPGSRALYLYVSEARTPENVVIRFLIDNGYGWPRSSDTAFIPPSQSDLQATIAEVRGP